MRIIALVCLRYGNAKSATSKNEIVETEQEVDQRRKQVEKPIGDSELVPNFDL